MSKYILITGAEGFIGSNLRDHLLSAGHNVIGLTNRTQSEIVNNKYIHISLDLASEKICPELLSKTWAVVHCAGRAHIRDVVDEEALRLHRVANVDITQRLLKQICDYDVKRFVFLSSIGVNGKLNDKPFTVSDIPDPKDAYAISKLQAEKVIKQTADKSNLQSVVIRPPLVYGPGVKGNFLTMLGWLEWGLPLPLSSVKNKRSFVSVDNLIDFIVTCLFHPNAVNKTFLVSDDEDLSTSELIKRTCLVLNKSARLFPFPCSLLQMIGGIIRKKDVIDRLTGNLQVDISETKKILDWVPPYKFDDGLYKTVQWYINK